VALADTTPDTPYRIMGPLFQLVAHESKRAKVHTPNMIRLSVTEITSEHLEAILSSASVTGERTSQWLPKSRVRTGLADILEKRSNKSVGVEQMKLTARVE
jgi:hypothetical protein